MTATSPWREDRIPITGGWHHSRHPLGWTNGALTIHHETWKGGTRSYVLSHSATGCAIHRNLKALEDAQLVAFRLMTYTSVNWFLAEPWDDWDEGHPDNEYSGLPQRLLANIPREVQDVLDMITNAQRVRPLKGAA